MATLKGQLDEVHTAIFGWPLDYLSPTAELLQSASLQEATCKLLRTERVRLRLAGHEALSELRAQLDLIHKAIFGWPLDDLSLTDELLRAESLQDATQILLSSSRVRFHLRDVMPAWPTDKWVCADFLDLRIWINLNDSYVARGVLEGNWENEEVGFVLDQLSPGDVMFDVGANVGVYGLQAARKVGSEGRVIAFEPQADTYAALARSVQENGFGDRMDLHNIALGDRDGPAAVWRHHPSNPGASFITEEPVAGAGNATQLTRLDSLAFDRQVKLLKMDIEGYEPLLVAGGRNFFRKHQPIIVTEWFPRAMQEVGGVSWMAYFEDLTLLGYRIHVLEGSRLGPAQTAQSLGQFEKTPEPFNIACIPRG